jgi:2-phospho-L-lactate guanylyltransferase
MGQDVGVTSTSSATAPDGGWLVIVPVKRLDGAKTRLSTRPAGVRRRLALAFALDTVAAARQARGVAEVHVVTDDEQVGRAMDALGAGWVRDSTGAGLNEALRHAELALREDHGDRDIAALAGDLPALSPDELARALALATGHDRSFVPDAAGTGSTFLAVRAGVPLDPRFGPRSCAAHARSGAVRLEPGTAPGLRRDVDTEVDLWDAVRLGVGPATTAALEPSP